MYGICEGGVAVDILLGDYGSCGRYIVKGGSEKGTLLIVWKYLMGGVGQIDPRLC
jgi:hypothetical protein